MKSKSTGKRGMRVLLLTLIVLIVSFVLLLKVGYGSPSPGKLVSLSTVYAFADDGQIMSATLLDEDSQIAGERCASAPAPATVPTPVVPGPTAPSPPPAAAPPTCDGPVEKFHVSYPRSDVATQQLIEKIRTSGAEVVVDKQTDIAMAKLIATFIFPLLMLANLFGLIFLSRSGDSSIGDIAGFGTIRRKRQRKQHQGTGVTFADVAGAEESVAELREVIDYLKNPERFEAYGAAAPKGVLLFGPPGCGKTLLARAAAGESGVPFFSISGAEFVESLVGVGAARVRDVFRQVREAAPAILFIDEIDAVGRRRSGEGQTGGEREQTVNQLLVEIDGFEVTAGVVIMGATNRADILDPALLRPGRFDRHITLTPPDIHGRQSILELHATKKPISPEVDFEGLARRTPGFTGADLANVINEAALQALRQGKGAQIDSAHLSEAVLRVLHGSQRRGHLMTAEERKRVAFHEAGHALVAAGVGHGSEMHRVSIVARGRGLGQSVVTADSERLLHTKSEMQAQLAMAMGGLAAEELQFGEASTAAEDDIERATVLAREMVGIYGMSEQIGRLRLLSNDNGYDGGEAAALTTISGQTMAEFDHEVKRLVTDAELFATDLLVSHRDELEAMVEALERDETLEGPALQRHLSVIGPEANLFGGNGAAASARRTTSPARKTRSPR